MRLRRSFAPDSQGQELAQPIVHQQQRVSKQPVQSDGDAPASSTEPCDVHLDEDAIRRRILEAKKQKKAPTSAWSSVSSPYAIAAVFCAIVGAIICLSLVPEDSRFFSQNGQRARPSEARASDSYENDDDQEQQEMYYQQQQQQQQRERRRQFEPKRQLDNEEDTNSDWSTGKDDDRFFENSASDREDGDDDYAPWNDKPKKQAEPAPSRTHRVVQQRMAPPEAGEKLRV